MTTAAELTANFRSTGIVYFEISRGNRKFLISSQRPSMGIWTLTEIKKEKTYRIGVFFHDEMREFLQKIDKTEKK